MTDIETAWLAGILEGEGCFYIKNTPKIILSMTDEDIVNRAACLMDKPYHTVPARSHQRKPVHTTAIHGEKAIEIMVKILPHMGIRRSAKIREVIAKARARPGQASGERCGSAKITDEQAREIRRIYVKGSKKVGESSAYIAERFGISQRNIWHVINTRKEAVYR